MSASPAMVPPSLPGYRYVELIGSGGFSEVYLYEHEMSGLKVAVKVLNDPVGMPSDREQFLTEARAMARLAGHPNIVRVSDADFTGDGRPYLIMHYYPLPNLYVRARREQFSVVEVLRIGVLVGSAVDITHRAGILHRDIKPHNILTGQYGEPALTDFGIAARTDAAGAGGFSYHWAAPEVVTGAADGDERADVYSLAATLWHLLAGRAPFADETGNKDVLALISRIRDDPPPPTGRRDVPESLERLLRHGMAKNPAARPQSALDMVRSLQAIEQELRLPVTKEAVAASEPSVSAGPVGPVLSAEAADGDETRVRNPRVIGAQPGVARRNPAPVPLAAVPRQREFLADQAPTRTKARQLTAEQAPVPDGNAGALGRSRGKVIAGLVVAVLIVGTGAVLAIAGHPASHPRAAPSRSQGTGGGGIAIGPGATAPGTPVITGTRMNTHELRFRWTYANPASGDFFKWKRDSGGPGKRSGTTTKPVLFLAARRNRTVCIQVEVVRSDGSEASAESSVRCMS